jgi:site-specific DNA-cytosine methylase
MQKQLEEKGESGQTFWGMIDWIDQAQPPIIIIENVSGAPWDQKVQLFEKRGYVATFLRLDTKHYYIPHTRQRGYLVAIKSTQKKAGGVVKAWAGMVKELRRPASSALDAFMFSNDDPRVLKGRARLIGECTEAEGQSRAGRVDWTKCETDHQHARFREELGEKRPLTGWSESGSVTMPSFAWNEWTNAQVHRIHDLMDINTLRLAKEDLDPSFKTMIWNLSQNVDRDTIGRLGLSPCLTPSGVPYVTSRGGPLVGEELLKLQGIPSDDLLLTKESEGNLKDLAGNAMSTTVVGACMLSALINGHQFLLSQDDASTSKERKMHSLVPRPLFVASDDVTISRDFGDYASRPLLLGPQQLEGDLSVLLQKASSSSRKCLSEGAEECLPVGSLRICSECGQTASHKHATTPGRYEEHEFTAFPNNEPRMQPAAFRRELLQFLPMRLELNNLSSDTIDKPGTVDEDLWFGWKKGLQEATRDKNDSPLEFRFTNLIRGTIWTANYTSPGQASRLELRLSPSNATWLLFARPPLEQGLLRKALERPVAQMRLLKSNSSFTVGSWQLCLPEVVSVNLMIEGQGTMDSWRRRLGLEGMFATETRYETLRISLETEGHDQLKAQIDGEYRILPKCGTSCGSLMKREKKTVTTLGSVSENNETFFFIESGRYSLPDDDAYVFARTSHRIAYGEYRELLLQIDPAVKYRPIRGSVDNVSQSLSALVPGKWVSAVGASLTLSEESAMAAITEPTGSLSVPVTPDGWRTCVEIVSCSLAMAADDSVYVQCRTAQSELEVNLRKSKQILQQLSFATSRLQLSEIFNSGVNDGWIALDSSSVHRIEENEVACPNCAPTKPPGRWTPVQKNGKVCFQLIEDGRAAAVYERALKERPRPWLMRLRWCDGDGGAAMIRMSIGLNAVSLAQRALGLFPPDTLPRRVMIETGGESNCTFDFRIISHIEKQTANFQGLRFTSNKGDAPANQPPNFRHPLRPEQLR